MPAQQDLRTREEVAQILHATLVFRYPYMKGRDQRMDQACRILSRPLSFSTQRAAALSIAARYHDLGMLALPEKLVLEARDLSPAEQSLVRAHTVISNRLIAKLFPDHPEAAEFVALHHERTDGMGPHRLKADAIPAAVSILALAGALESMVNGRPHRPPLSRQQIISEITSQSGTQFPVRTVKIFLNSVDEVLEVLKAEPRTIMKPESSAQSGAAAPSAAMESAGSADVSTTRAAAVSGPVSAKAPAPPASDSIVALVPEGEAERREAAIRE